MKRILCNLAVTAAVLCVSGIFAGAQTPTPGQLVDLGLSVKWAGWNIGASSPEEYGEFYAWGETEPKEKYLTENYKYYQDGKRDAITKYCCDHRGYEGFKDGKNTLEPSDDVASVKWGDGWRMPTAGEVKELHKQCKWSYITYKGVEGWYVKGKNGNSIFLPHTGTKTNLRHEFFGSTYPSSQLCPGESWGCDGLFFVRSAALGTLGLMRETGRAVRAVKE